MDKDSNLEQSKTWMGSFSETCKWLESYIVTGVEFEDNWDGYLSKSVEELRDAVQIYTELNEKFLKKYQAEFHKVDSDGNDVCDVDISDKLTKEEKEQIKEASFEMARCLGNMGGSVNECFRNAKNMVTVNANA